MARVPKAKFNLRRPNGENETLIYLVLRYRGKRLVHSTGCSILPKDWDEKCQRPVLRKGRRDLYVIQRKLDDLTAYCRNMFIEHDYGKIDVDDFKRELDRRSNREEPEAETDPPKEKGIPDFLTFIEQEIADMEARGMRRNSLKTFRLHANQLQDFAKDRGAFDYGDVDWNFRLELIDWLADRQVQLAYGNKTLSMLRQFLERARRKKYHRNTDYQGTGWAVTQKKARGQTIILTLQELNLLYNHPFKGFLAKVRDLFLIGTGTGQRFSDFSRYTANDFYKTVNNVSILSIISQKTDTPAKVPLNLFPWLLPTLEKYDYASPPLSMQKFNEGIKKVCKIVGIDQNVMKVDQYMGRKAHIAKRYVPKYQEISSHTCRRSFATNLYRQGYSLAQIMPMTGHTTESQLRDYIGIDAEQNAERIALEIMNREKSGRLVNFPRDKTAHS